MSPTHQSFLVCSAPNRHRSLLRPIQIVILVPFSKSHDPPVMPGAIFRCPHRFLPPFLQPWAWLTAMSNVAPSFPRPSPHLTISRAFISTWPYVCYLFITLCNLTPLSSEVKILSHVPFCHYDLNKTSHTVSVQWTSVREEKRNRRREGGWEVNDVS